MGKLTIKQILDALVVEVREGKTYLGIARALLAVEPAVFYTASTFFGSTLDGCVMLAQMTVARLYDADPGAVSVRMMLDQARIQISLFQRGDRQQVSEAIVRSEGMVAALEPVFISIRHRRNEWLAHLDSRTVRDPKALATKAKLSMEDLERTFEQTETTIKDFTQLFDGTIGAIRFAGDDDYIAVFNHIRRSMAAEKKEFDAAFEAQFGHLPPRS